MELRAGHAQRPACAWQLHRGVPGVVALEQRVKDRALDLGFDLVGIADARPFAAERALFERRVEAGFLEHWHYSRERIADACDPQRSLPGARSIVCTATCYFTGDTPHDPNAPGLRGAISNYAWGADYHRTIGGRLETLADFIRTLAPGEQARASVDTGPMVDRAAAVRAGIGWFGKSGNVLTADYGSWVFLGEVVTTLALTPDVPRKTNCGECVACVVECPTGAIGPDGAVDGRRCISDLTQMRGFIPRELRAAIGNRLWGCDTCQTCCPVNDRKQNAKRDEFRPLPHIGTSMDLVAVLRMTKSQFRRCFAPTAMAWRGKTVLQRNAAVALGNSRDGRAVPPLVEALDDTRPVIRGHAAWALGRLGGTRAMSALRSALAREADAQVRDEISAALAASG